MTGCSIVAEEPRRRNEELGGLHFQGFCQGHHGIQGNHPVSPLDQADVIGVQVGSGGQLFLG